MSAMKRQRERATIVTLRDRNSVVVSGFTYNHFCEGLSLQVKLGTLCCEPTSY